MASGTTVLLPSTAAWPQAARRRAIGAAVLLTCVLSAGIGLRLGHFGRYFTTESVYLVLPTTFTYWDREPVTRHLGLAFNEPGDFEAGRAYEHFSPIWLGLVYLLLNALRLTGLPYGLGQNYIVLVTFGVMLWLFWWSLAWPKVGGASTPARWGASLPLVVLAFSVAATQPALWKAAAIGNPERQSELLAVLAAAFLSVLDFRDRPLGRSGFLVILAVALLAPECAPVLLLVAVCLGWRAAGAPVLPGLRWNEWRSQGAILAAVTAVMLLAPYLMLRVGGWVGLGSSPLYRSGLDGSTQYFSTMLQAIVYPFDAAGREWRVLPVPLVAAAVAAGTAALSRPLAGRMVRQLLVCWAPALYWVIAFPQAVSIHPYLYDFGLLFPPAFCLAFWLSQAEVRHLLAGRRGLALGLFFMLSGLLMTNWLDLARPR